MNIGSDNLTIHPKARINFFDFSVVRRGVVSQLDENNYTIATKTERSDTAQCKSRCLVAFQSKKLNEKNLSKVIILPA